MGKRFSFWLVSTCIFLVIIPLNSAADDVYVAQLQILHAPHAADNVKIEDDLKRMLLLHEELIKISTSAINFRPLESLPKEKLAELDSKIILTTLDALAACFFFNIEHLVYGTISIGEKNEYETRLSVYNKKLSKVVDELVFTAPVTDERAYMAGLAAKLNEQLKFVINTFKPEPENPVTKETQITEDTTVNPNTEATNSSETGIKTVEEVTSAQTEASLNEAQDQTINSITEKTTDIVQTPTAPKDNNQLLLILISGGYYFPIINEWNGKTMPCVSIEEGVKFPTPWIETEEFDLMYQFGCSFNYSFALNKPDNPYYTHFHSLTAKISLELDFEYNNFISIFFGGGPQYKFQIIDYMNLANRFFTDIPHAFGLFGDIGIQFLIGENKTMAVGITNVFDVTFLAHIYLDYKIHLHLLLRV